MSDKFDPYREALVVETETVWPEGTADSSADERHELDRRLHATASLAHELHYIRQHTGFTRRIVVHPADLERLAPQPL